MTFSMAQQQQQQQQPQPSTNAQRQHRKRCAFFNSPQGCRRGDQCMFAHSPSPSSSPPLNALPGAGRPKTSRERASRPSTVEHKTTPNRSPAASVYGDNAPQHRQVATAVAADIKPMPTQQLRQHRLPRSINPARAPVSKPVPKSLSTTDSLTLDEQHQRLRDYELSQIKSRFGSSPSFKDMAATSTTETVWRLSIVPSDPDFPYEISALEIKLHVPNPYPKEPAWIEVLNINIPKGFARNLEKGFDEHAKKAITISKSLLAQLSWLDVNMEMLLQQPPAPTIRFVSHTTTTTSTSSPPAAADLARAPTPPKPQPVLPNPSQPPAPAPIHRSWTTQERQEAAAVRQQQIAQLQARFRGSIKILSPTSVEIALEPTQRTQLPLQWEGPLMIHMLIPTLYPLESCSIQLGYNGANPEFEEWRATNIERGFEKIVESAPPQARTLFQYLNHLNRDLKSLTLLPEPQPSTNSRTPSEAMAQLRLQDKTESHQASVSSPVSTPAEPDNSKAGRRLYHVKMPDLYDGERASTSEDADDSQAEEQDEGETDDAETTDSEEQYSAESDGDDNNSGPKEASTSSMAAGKNESSIVPKRGVEIRMPGIVLEHVSLLQCNLLSLLVRCNRCKALVDIPNLKPDSDYDLYPAQPEGEENGSQGGPSAATRRQNVSGDKQTWKNCDNCLSPLGAHFRPEFIHMQSRTLGYLDLAGCTAYDLLPSTFVPTCDGCDQVLGSGVPGGVVGFRQKVGRGMSATANCRNCHQRLVFGLEGEVKFIKLAPGDLLHIDSQTLEQLPKKKKGKGGSLTTMYEEAIKVGEPLPKKGACEHYKKSRRWFRFPCCSKIYPCHMCHDEKETGHEAEYAKRMICGHCSREQPASDKPCQCGQSPVKSSKPTSAFWEGGEGVRDKTRMSTKDPRKFKGSNKTVAKKQVGAENVHKRDQRSKKQ